MLKTTQLKKINSKPNKGISMNSKIFALLTILSMTISSYANDNSKIVAQVGTKRLELASTLIKALDQNNVCETDAYPTEINKLVQSAKYQVSKETLLVFSKSIKTNSIIKKNLAFRFAVLDQDTHIIDLNLENLKKLFTETQFHGFGSGVYGSRNNITLHADYTATVQTLELLDDEPWTKWNTSKTTWSLTKNKITGTDAIVLTLGNEQYKLVFRDGEIWLAPVGTDTDSSDNLPLDKMLSSTNSYCEA